MTRFAALLIFIAVVCHASVASAGPLVVRCTGQANWGGNKIHQRIDIVIPERQDRIVTLSDEQGTPQDTLDMWPVGVGSIEITESLEGQSSSHRHKLVVTRMPGSANALVGFYLVNTYVQAVRADLYKKEKPFVYFDTYNNETISGRCE